MALLLDRATIEGLLDMKEAIELMEQAFVELGNGAVDMPQRLTITDTDRAGWTAVMPANLKDTGAVPFTVKVPGGTIGGLTMRTSGTPRFSLGEDVVLFLKPGTARCDVYGWYQGKYTVVGDLVREKQGTTIEQFLGSIRSELRASEKDK